MDSSQVFIPFIGYIGRRNGINFIQQYCPDTGGIGAVRRVSVAEEYLCNMEAVFCFSENGKPLEYIERHKRDDR